MLWESSLMGGLGKEVALGIDPDLPSLDSDEHLGSDASDTLVCRILCKCMC